MGEGPRCRLFRWSCWGGDRRGGLAGRARGGRGGRRRTCESRTREARGRGRGPFWDDKPRGDGNVHVGEQGWQLHLLAALAISCLDRMMVVNTVD